MKVFVVLQVDVYKATFSTREKAMEYIYRSQRKSVYWLTVEEVVIDQEVI